MEEFEKKPSTGVMWFRSIWIDLIALVQGKYGPKYCEAVHRRAALAVMLTAHTSSSSNGEAEFRRRLIHFMNKENELSQYLIKAYCTEAPEWTKLNHPNVIEQLDWRTDLPKLDQVWDIIASKITTDDLRSSKASGAIEASKAAEALGPSKPVHSPHLQYLLDYWVAGEKGEHNGT